jgi:uncharacterized protein YgfB (UPF0149 family)
MFDDGPASLGFETLANALLEQGVAQSPSEVHGCFAGLLGGGVPADGNAGLASLSAALGTDIHGELAGELVELFDVTLASLQDESFDFHPLLPDEDSNLDERVVAMTDWCRGFLSGYAQARVGTGRTDATVPSDSAEALKDFALIAQAGFSGDEDGDESESAFEELVEYLRFAAMNIMMDTVAQASEAAGHAADAPTRDRLH